MEDFFSFYCKNNKPVELEPNKDDSLFDLDDDQDTNEPDNDPNDQDNNGPNDQDNNADLKDKIAELEEMIKKLTSKDQKDGE